uniref:Uncharacterized protein n=1 Tax=Romanomermis culicivorax TaxID=13658 RepID=A0A915KS51_ROMCU
MNGKLELKHGADSVAGNAILPIQSDSLLGKDKRDQMTKMHSFGTRSATGVQKERLAFLVQIKHE